jgi:choline dehydrogenase-like flavoprotein
MTDWSGINYAVDPQTAAATHYDVVVVGSGVSGSILAKQISLAGYRVLIMEAAGGDEVTVADYEKNVERFYTAVSKDDNSPYRQSPNAPMPRGFESQKLRPGEPSSSGYLVQKGPFETDGTYAKALGGTTRHWEGKAFRLLPDDFKLRSRFGRGRDWPLEHASLQPHYESAERELGVAADVADQTYGGQQFRPGYVYPMHRMPPSYLDQAMATDLDGTQVSLDGETFSLNVRSTPQARNGIPNPAYDDGAGYQPSGAVSLHQAELGERCQGNANCVPICPVQAKYDGRRTLAGALGTGRVDLLTQTVASHVHVDAQTGRVTEIEFRSYRDFNSSEHTTGTVRATIFVLAANAIENARLMLASNLHSSSGLMGRNLMDHAYLLTWALMPTVTGALRGPLCTSGIEEFRTGAFRRRLAAFRAGIHNDGWGWATGSPYTVVDDLVDSQNKFGPDLRQALVSQVSRQLLLAFMVEVLPEESNRVSVDPRYVDQLGNPRPIISLRIPDYTMEAIAVARRLSRRIYQRIGAEDYTSTDPAAAGAVTYDGNTYMVRGGNHWAGTHLMGSSPKDSVVDAKQRSWDHDNLYLAGAGSMPSIGAANTTLTLSALAFMSAECIVEDLRSAAAPLELRAGRGVA